MQRTSNTPEKNRAFTLIELLVVIAIMAILLAFSFPIIMSMRESGNSTRCISNLRQIGGAIGQYMLDNDGYIPSSAGYNVTGGGANSIGFSHYAAPLPCLLGVGTNAPTAFATREAYEKPSAKHPFNCPSCKTSFRTYSANMHALAHLPGGNTYKPRKMNSFSNLSKLVLIADDTAGDPAPNNSGGDQFSESDFTNKIGTRHGGKANALFGDMHIEAIDRKNLNATENIKQLQ